MNTSPIDPTILRAFGLTDREGRVYLAALELGEALQLNLAQKAGLKRTSLRELLPGLLDRGILQEVVRGKRKYLVARDPRELLADLERQTLRAQQLLPSLLGLQNNLKEKPRVRFFEGIEGVKQVFQETIRIGLPIYTLVDVSAIDPELERWLVEEYVPQRNHHQIHNFVLVNDTPNVDQLIPTNRYRHNVKVPADQFPFAMEIDIFGDFVSFNHFRRHETPSATLIQSQSAAATLRSAHQLIWHLLSKKKTG